MIVLIGMLVGFVIAHLIFGDKATPGLVPKEIVKACPPHSWESVPSDNSLRCKFCNKKPGEVV